MQREGLVPDGILERQDSLGAAILLRSSDFVEH